MYTDIYSMGKFHAQLDQKYASDNDFIHRTLSTLTFNPENWFNVTAQLLPIITLRKKPLAEIDQLREVKITVNKNFTHIFFYPIP